MAHDFYLKIKGIDGESKADGHKGEIDLLSWSWGETQTGTGDAGGGHTGGRVVMQDFHFVMSNCKASPKLMLACATGEHIGDAVLTCRKAGGTQQAFLKIKFTDLIVSSYQTGGSGGQSALPTDQISLNFAKIEVEYLEQNEKGAVGAPVKAGYDLKNRKKV